MSARRPPSADWLVLGSVLLFIAVLLLRFGAWRRADAAPGVRATTDPAIAEVVLDPTGAASGQPDLSVGPDGAVWLSWLERADSTRWMLRVARLDGARWNAPATVAAGDSFFVNNADFPRVLALGGGRLVAAWPWRRPGGDEALEVRFATSADSGRTWSAPRVPHADPSATEHGFVSLAPERGGVRLVWLDGRGFAGRPADSGADMQLRTAWLGPDGALTPDALLDPRVCDCCQTSVAAAERGTVVAYRDRSPQEIRDTGVLLQDADRWTPSTGVPQERWKIAGCPVNGPSVTARGARVGLAWYAAPAESARVRASLSHDGGARFGPAARVDDGDPVGRLATALLDDGSLAVAWVERAARGGSLRVRRIGPGGVPGRSVEVAQLGTTRGVPRLAVTGERLLVAWADGSPARVHAASLPFARVALK